MKSRKPLISYLYLLAGFASLFFFNGRWIVPLAAFLAPLFIIRFLRFQKPLKGFVIILFTGWIVNIFVWRGMMPASGFFYYILTFMMNLFPSLVYILDRIISRKIRGIKASLVFPSAYVLMEFIIIATNPSGSYGTLAHTQTSLPLMQILSLTGIWGLVFIITWTASLINRLWDHSFQKREIQQALLVYALPLFAVILFGQVRLAVNPGNTTVRIAAIDTGKSSLNHHIEGGSEIHPFFRNCEIAASSGAEIIFGTETTISLQREEEGEWIENARQKARDLDIYLGLPMKVTAADSPDTLPENKITWISPGGEKLFTYHKARPTPGEGDYGDGIIPYFDTPHGRVASVICFDMDFPSLIRQVGAMDLDIMLVPGSDWKEISPYHTHVAAARAIEHGFHLVRAATRGWSAAFNNRGQVLSSLDYFRSDEAIFYSDVPTRGQRTLYSRWGDFFPWLCLLFLLFSIIMLIKNRGESGTG